MEKVNRRTTEEQGASLRVAPTDAAEEELTRKEREEYREDVLALAGGGWLDFQCEAVRRYGAAAGIMLRELLFWDGKGDPSGGWTYMTKRGPRHSCEERTGLTPKSQDGGRKRLEDAGVLEVERRARRNREGEVMHPSPVLLHYRLKLPELLDQMAEDAAALKRRLEHADAATRTRRSEGSPAPIGTPEEADADDRTLRMEVSSAQIRALESAVTGAPYTEGTLEATPKATPEATPEETAQETPERGRRSAPSASRRPVDRDGGHGSEKTPLPKDSPVPADIIEMIDAAGAGTSEDEHLDAICGHYGISAGQRDRYRPYVRQALEELQAREGAG